ncbi:MAG: GDSL-type esterase/lipase family protein [Thermomicrobiales bacterium]
MTESPARRLLLLLRGLALAALILLGGTASSATPAAPPTRHGIGQLYLALGDSLGVGLLSSMPETRGYVAQFHALLEQAAHRPVQLQNLSISGETAASMLTSGQLTDAQTAIARAYANGWQVSPITVDIGGNDMRALQDKDDAAREAGLTTFRANIARIFDTLVAATTVNGQRQSDIITMTVYNPYGGDPAVVHSLAWWVERFNAAISEEASGRGIAVADVYTRFKGHEQELTWIPLDFHANNQGHLAMAEEFWRAAGYDTTAPDATIVAPAAGALDRAVPTIKIQASDNIGVTSVTVQVDGQPLPAPYYYQQFGLWVSYWDARNAPPGKHQLTVTVTDAAGNTTTRDMTVTR